MSRLKNTLRIKVTGKCNRNCFFCHQEGGMHQIDEIKYSKDLELLINRLYSDFNIHTVALTGGEPLLYEGLQEFMLLIRNNTPITDFTLTTNGSIYKEKTYWVRMKELGTCKVNISISDILNSVGATGTHNEISIFENQMRTIENLIEVGIIPNVNVVVYNDQKHLINLLKTLFSKNMQFGVALLPDLTNLETFNYSQNVIQEALFALGFNKKALHFRKGTSNAVYDYITNAGKELQVKTTKANGEPKRLYNMCEKCSLKDECQEGFYGIRVESCAETLMVRLCLYKSSADVLMPVGVFLDSLVYKELQETWN